jgi:hypothetical protein
MEVSKVVRNEPLSFFQQAPREVTVTPPGIMGATKYSQIFILTSPMYRARIFPQYSQYYYRSGGNRAMSTAFSSYVPNGGIGMSTEYFPVVDGLSDRT